MMSLDLAKSVLMAYTYQPTIITQSMLGTVIPLVLRYKYCEDLHILPLICGLRVVTQASFDHLPLAAVVNNPRRAANDEPLPEKDSGHFDTQALYDSLQHRHVVPPPPPRPALLQRTAIHSSAFFDSTSAKSLNCMEVICPS
jgi:hypothetical protein